MNTDFTPCILIPVYDHEAALPAVVESLCDFGLPILLIDDGSQPICAAVIDRLAADRDTVAVVRHAHNRGKGAAVKTGLKEAWALGYTHAVQIDADGQHAVADLSALLDAARENPGALISGIARFDDSVPRGRLYGRYLSLVWVWINALSLAVDDALCGFRVYPLRSLVELIEAHSTGDRMEFDVEILIRAQWAGIPVVSRPVGVRYPADGISHFDVLGDNLRLSKMQARMFFGMLRRAPALIARRFR